MYVVFNFTNIGGATYSHEQDRLDVHDIGLTHGELLGSSLHIYFGSSMGQASPNAVFCLYALMGVEGYNGANFVPTC